MIDDEELEKLREEKIDDLETDQEDAIEEQRNLVKQRARQYLTKDARERLGTVRTAKPDLASSIETQVAQLGEMGRIEKMTEDELKDILKKLQTTKEETNIKFRR